ncbi:hypothetical protein CDL60_06230 [Roseateles noduli]|nr:hypothetical protein CDL60_06230 [Roseateles noduli]
MLTAAPRRTSQVSRATRRRASRLRHRARPRPPNRRKAIAARPAVARGRVVNRTNGKPGECLRERHSAADLDALGLAR